MLKACLASVAIAVTVAACGGGGGSDDTGGGGGGGGVTPGPGPAPGPAPAPVIAENCAEAGTGGAAPAGSENPSSIGAKIDAYANCTSVFPGQKITFHASDNAGTVGVSRTANVTIWRVGSSDEQVQTRQISISKQFIPKDAWVNCCNWPVSYEMKVPDSWKSGFYKARFDAPGGGESSWVSFVVKNPTPGSFSKLAFQVPFDTSQMYNEWGGKSAYTYNSTSGIKAEEVSMRRPSAARDGNEQILGIVHFIRWAEQRNIKLEYLAGEDLHTTPKVLDPYKAVVTVGHDEYWSQEMRNELDRYVDAGGNLAVMSGNTMWWRIQKVTDAYGQPIGKIIGNRRTGTETANWFEFDNETRTIGASYFKGGYVDQNTQTDQINEGYTVYEPSHWAFTGTGLTLGSTFGQASKIHRYESDGLDLNFVGGKPVPTNTDGAPAGTKVVAFLALPSGWDSPSTNAGFAGQGPTLTGTVGPNAVMSTFTRPNGGTVFNFGTTDYYRALTNCTGSGVVQSSTCKVAENVLNHLVEN